MRLYTFETRKGRPLIGVEAGGRLIDLNAAHAARLGRRSVILADSMLALIRGGQAALRQARQALAFALKKPKVAAKFTHDFNAVRLRAPIPRPGKIFCSGLNYR